jgi:hypothetical protein
VATVIAFGSADSHDEHYFADPDGMIRGDVKDPRLTLDNLEITRRHVRAFLLQNYHQDRLPGVDARQPHDLFSVLGTVAGFRSENAILNIHDFDGWLNDNEAALRARVESWIPDELSAHDRSTLLSELKTDCLAAVSAAIESLPDEKPNLKDGEGNQIGEDAPEEGEENPTQKPNSGQLLDRLLYRGILPRYAFPTDVATFHVFDLARSSRFRPIMRFAPSQGLPIALTQYAPGKQIWISGKCYSSGAVYSVIPGDTFRAWEDRRLYCECSACGFARTFEIGQIARGDKQDCPACGASNTFGEARYWLRPPGFAHPVDVEEVTSPDDMPETSYATRAKLTMHTPSEESHWTQINPRIRVLKARKHLLVSNTGPKRDGYTYCVKCGRIEASSDPTPLLTGQHRKPYPDEKQPTCEGAGTTRHIVLGTDFITDIVLFSMQVDPPLRLKPGQYPTDLALRTVSEALAKAASQLLEIEPGELMAEYRPSLTPEGRDGFKAEIFLYDTLPGGAGFSSQLVGRGNELFQRALKLMETCAESCESSCYRCLRSFKNKFEHRLLDRHVGAELVEYLLTGNLADFDPKRLQASTTLLYNDLLRQGLVGITFQKDVTFPLAGCESANVPILAVTTRGEQFAIALSGPLTTGHPADPALAGVAQQSDGPTLVVVNELLVRGNLPAATRDVRQCLGV